MLGNESENIKFYTVTSYTPNLITKCYRPVPKVLATLRSH